MTKIPVKIVEFSDGGKKIQEVMIDLVDTMQIDGDPGKKIEQFRDKYFDLVKQTQNIMPKEKSKRKPSHFWQIGKLLYDFNNSIKNDFEIRNYDQSIMRDFKYFKSPRTIAYIIELGKFFKKNEILDSTPITLYFELLQKRNTMQSLGLFGKEKERLVKLAKQKKLPGKMKYREELKKALNQSQKISIGK